MTEKEKARRLAAEACKNILWDENCENRRFWERMKSVCLNASEGDFDNFIKDMQSRKDFMQLLGELVWQINWIIAFDKVFSAGRNSNGKEI